MHVKTLTPERQVSESGYRFLNPELGRWCSRDPVVEPGFVGPVLFPGEQARLTQKIAFYAELDPMRKGFGGMSDRLTYVRLLPTEAGVS